MCLLHEVLTHCAGFTEMPLKAMVASLRVEHEPSKLACRQESQLCFVNACCFYVLWDIIQINYKK